MKQQDLIQEFDIEQLEQRVEFGLCGGGGGGGGDGGDGNDDGRPPCTNPYGCNSDPGGPGQP